jgi:hypothetical protein
MAQRVNIIVTRLFSVAQRMYAIVTRINQFTPHVLFNNVPYLLNHSICIMCNVTRVPIHTTRHVILLIQKLLDNGMIYPVYYNTEASEKLIPLFVQILTGYGPKITPYVEQKMSNSSFREVSSIAKFNGRNFSLWKFGCCVA